MKQQKANASENYVNNDDNDGKDDDDDDDGDNNEDIICNGKKWNLTVFIMCKLNENHVSQNIS